MLVVQNLSYKTILKDLSLSLSPGSITALIGKSGAGKTTMLECITQLKRSYTGSVTFKQTDIKALSCQQRAQTIGLVFQQFNLFEHLTALENCIQPLIVTKQLSRTQAYEKALSMLTYFDMQEHKDKYPTQLSGGQQQRVAIARALVLEPQVLCLDEPTSALDPENSALLAELLKKLSMQGITILVSSQDMEFVKSAAQEVAFLKDGTLIDVCNTQNIQELSAQSELQQFLTYF